MSVCEEYLSRVSEKLVFHVADIHRVHTVQFYLNSNSNFTILPQSSCTVLCSLDFVLVKSWI